MHRSQKCFSIESLPIDVICRFSGCYNIGFPFSGKILSPIHIQRCLQIFSLLFYVRSNNRLRWTTGGLQKMNKIRPFLALAGFHYLFSCECVLVAFITILLNQQSIAFFRKCIFMSVFRGSFLNYYDEEKKARSYTIFMEFRI